MANQYITIEGLRFYGRHGVMPQEAAVGNEFELSMTIAYPLDNAIASDDVADTLNYAEAVEVALAAMRQPSQLLEHALGCLRQQLRQRYPKIQGGTLTLKKLTPPIAGAQMQWVGVTIDL